MTPRLVKRQTYFLKCYRSVDKGVNEEETWTYLHVEKRMPNAHAGAEIAIQLFDLRERYAYTDVAHARTHIDKHIYTQKYVHRRMD